MGKISNTSTFTYSPLKCPICNKELSETDTLAIDPITGDVKHKRCE